MKSLWKHHRVTLLTNSTFDLLLHDENVPLFLELHNSIVSLLWAYTVIFFKGIDMF